MKTLIYGGRLIDPANRVDGRLNLLIGIFVGSMVLCSGALLAGLNETFYSFIHTFESNSNTIVLASFLLIGALIYLIKKSGGIDGCTEVMLKERALIKSKRGANLFTWLLGIIIFTSGSLSCMVTGSISRPFNDALKVPHEKSAFIIHATSTPWCVLFPLSGWLAAMTGYLTSGGDAEGEAISVLLKSIQLNFYCILAVFGTLAAWKKRPWVTVCCTAAILLTAFSRMYLGVHTPLDVGVSLITGVLCVLLLTRLFDRL